MKIESDSFFLNADDVKINFNESLYDIIELNAKGNKSFKLQSMIKANGISTTRAHDSYEDTRETLLLSKLLMEKSPDIFNAALALRRKTDVLPKIKKEKIFCWHESFFKTKIYLSSRRNFSQDIKKNVCRSCGIPLFNYL